MDARTEYTLRDEIVRVGKLMWEKNFIAAGDGNLSVRLGSDRLLCTPSGFSKGFLNPDQLLLIDLQGNKVGANYGAARELIPSSEIRLHLECYRQRADVNAVIHAHPPSAIACSLVGLTLAKCILPEVVYELGTIPTLPYATPTSLEGPERIRDVIPSYDALILERHGSVTVGKNLWEAYMRLERLEHAALIALQANAVQVVTPLSDAQIQKLADLRRNVFARRGRDVCAECNACMVSDKHAARQHS
ncbi:MAG TPA: class II aldolase/adducin family protein [Anaerolineae bacterium]|nr:class II aldolase/adducin family protein [Anaerolineae bacterium]